MAGLPGASPPDTMAPGTPLVIVSIVLTLVAALLVSIRVFSRVFGSGAIGVDDLFIICSLGFSLALTVVNCYMVQFGFGLRTAQLSESDLHNALRFFWASQMLYKAVMGCTKTSILLLYLRLFPDKKFRIACFTVLIYVAGYAIASTIATFVQCTPVPRAWDKTIPGTCINLTAFWYSNSIASISGDIIILVLPIGKIRRLQLPRKQKSLLLFVFGMGGFVCITSILRMTTLGSASQSHDQTADTFLSTVWTTVEANTGIICACLPMMRMPLSRIIPRLVLRSRSSQNSRRIPMSLSCGMGGNSVANDVQQTLYVSKAAAKCSTASTEPIASIPLGVISKTTEVALSFEDRHSGASSVYDQQPTIVNKV